MRAGRQKERKKKERKKERKGIGQKTEPSCRLM